MYNVNGDLIEKNIISVVNSASATIENNITNFNKSLELLADGKTWKGGSAQYNIGELVKCYNAYKNAYIDFLTQLDSNCKVILEAVNSIISINHGNPIRFTSPKAVVFSEPKIGNLTLANGESGNPTDIIKCSENFVTYSDEIKNAYNKINTAFQDHVGPGKDSLDLSHKQPDIALKLREEVGNVISNLKLYDESSFKLVIGNLKTAANNIINGV